MLGKDYTIGYRGPKSMTILCVYGQLVVRNIASKLCRSDTVLENSYAPVDIALLEELLLGDYKGTKST